MPTAGRPRGSSGRPSNGRATGDAGHDDGFDSGEVEVLEDGSLSIPLLEEEVVVTKRWVVRERIIVRKSRTTSRETVHETVRREVADVEGVDGAAGSDGGAG